jgi:hypothetical protein
MITNTWQGKENVNIYLNLCFSALFTQVSRIRKFRHVLQRARSARCTAYSNIVHVKQFLLKISGRRTDSMVGTCSMDLIKGSSAANGRRHGTLRHCPELLVQPLVGCEPQPSGSLTLPQVKASAAPPDLSLPAAAEEEAWIPSAGDMVTVRNMIAVCMGANQGSD